MSNDERSAGGKSSICSGVRIFLSSIIASIIASYVAMRPSRTLPEGGHYSERSVMEGSIRAARHAGIQHATTETPKSSTITPT